MWTASRCNALIGKQAQGRCPSVIVIVSAPYLPDAMLAAMPVGLADNKVYVYSLVLFLFCLVMSSYNDTYEIADL